MLPMAWFERLWPFDVPVNALLRALACGDDGTAKDLGCLGLTEEDLGGEVGELHTPGVTELLELLDHQVGRFPPEEVPALELSPLGGGAEGAGVGAPPAGERDLGVPDEGELVGAHAHQVPVHAEA